MDEETADVAISSYTTAMLHEWLAAGLKKAGMTQSELARRLTEALGRSIDRAAVNKMLKSQGEKGRRIQADELLAIARILDIPAPARDDGQAISQIVGDVGAGALVSFYGEPEGGYETTERPEGASPETVAARVRGDSMPGVAEDDWLIFYDERVAGVPDDWIGKLCVVWLTDGRVLIKKVFRGRDPGAFDLVSTGPGYDPIRDEEVEWSSKVTWIKPR